MPRARATVLALEILACVAGDCAVETYYADVDLTLTGSALRDALHARVRSPHNVIPYTSDTVDVWDALKVLDADPDNADHVLGLYSRRSMPADSSGESTGWNREHSWPKSCGVGYTGADFSDLHHLFAADWNVNSARGNKDFGDCLSDNTATCESPAHSEAPGTADDHDSFLPPAPTRGDIARAVMYMSTRYDGSDTNTENLELVTGCKCDESGRLGSYAWLRQWHEDDPVDDAERARNDLVCSDYQQNRNPFIDYPELVAALFDDEDVAAERELACSGGGGGDDDATDPSLGPPLAPGDVLVVGAKSSNPDDFVLVFLTNRSKVDIEITDDGWEASGTLRGSEGTARLRLDDVRPGDTATLADCEVGANFALSASGDQLLVIDRGTFITAFQTGGPWSDATSSTTSALPPGLIDGETALHLDGTADAYGYVGTREGSAEELRALLTDSSNWEEVDALDASPFDVEGSSSGAAARASTRGAAVVALLLGAAAALAAAGS